jgi:RhoGAP domain
LGKIHELRAKVNNGKAPDPEILREYDPTVIAALLKLYLLELPDPLVSFTVYDIVKSIYSSSYNLEDVRNRISGIQNTLSQLRVTNIATLDALTQHFGRLIDITTADEDWISELAHNISYCIARPRLESSVTQHDRHSQRLIVDLITQRDKIFKDLKRNSVRKARPESLDESQRRQRFEARSRALSAARSPRLAPTDAPNGGDKTTPTHVRRVSGITGVLGNRPPSIALDPGDTLGRDTLNLDSGLPTGGADEILDKAAPVEVTVTTMDEPSVPVPELPTPHKVPSIGRTTRVHPPRTIGLQRHLKRESLQQSPSDPAGTEVQDKDAQAVAASLSRRSLDGGPVRVTLSDAPTRG